MLVPYTGSMPKRKPAKVRVPWVATVPFLFLAVLVLFRVLSFETYLQLVSEDGVLETLQFVFYFLSGALLWRRSWAQFQKRSNHLFALFFFIMGGVLLFVGLEEISWGQRFFGFRNPYFFAINNVQREVSVHNLSTFQPYLHGGYITLGLLLGVFVPLGRPFVSSKPLRRLLPGWELVGYFLPVSLLYLVLEAFPPVSLTGPNFYGFIWRDQEAVEMLLAMGLFMLFAKTLKRR